MQSNREKAIRNALRELGDDPVLRAELRGIMLAKYIVPIMILSLILGAAALAAIAWFVLTKFI